MGAEREFAEYFDALGCTLGRNGDRVPAHILYGENDRLTSLATISDFARSTGASLEVMPGGEHWFHTPKQMAILDEWIQRANFAL